MNINIKQTDLDKIEDTALAFYLFEGEELSEDLKTFDKKLGNALSNALKNKIFKAEHNEVFTYYTNNKLQVQRIVLLGLGKKDELTSERFRKAIATLTKSIKRNKQTSFSLIIRELEDMPLYLLATSIEEAITLSMYSFDTYKTNNKQETKLKQVDLIYHGENLKDFTQHIEESSIVSESVIFVRELINTPAGIATPQYLADKAKSIAEKNKTIKCAIYNEKQLEKMNMKAILAVGQGSANKSVLAVLEYKPKPKAPTFVLIGKGVCFDSGGLGLKPANYMKKMYYDMSGAATVLGIIHAAAQLKLPYNIVMIFPAVENMVSSTSYKPGDIITTYSGKTMEIQHTDAEGRVILADALAYAKTFKPDYIIDLATLTGAVSAALGEAAAAIMGNDDHLIQRLKAAGEQTYERLWQLPLYEEYTDMIKSEVADVVNMGSWDGKAGVTTAAAFLQTFVPEKTKWAHLDIAGVAFSEKNNAYISQGATGFGVRLLIKMLKDWK